MTLDEGGRRQTCLALEPVDVLCEHATEQTLLRQQLEEEVAGRGVVLVVCVEHLLREDPEGRGVLLEIVVIEDRGGIAEIGHRVFVQIAVQSVGGTEVGNAGSYH